VGDSHGLTSTNNAGPPPTGARRSLNSTTSPREPAPWATSTGPGARITHPLSITPAWVHPLYTSHLVLRVEPEMAVERKVGVDAAEFVRLRSAEVFHAEWTDPYVQVVDSSRSLDEVLHRVREVVWSHLP
jgi:hypothetical protein